nr:hypothetical protein [Verrucomicrobiales bacterium]
MKTILPFVISHSAFVILSLLTLPAAAQTPAIPFAQLGAEADKKGAGASSGITPTAAGAKFRALMQDLEAEATPEGLWLTSAADEEAGRTNRFRVRALAVGRWPAQSAERNGLPLASKSRTGDCADHFALPPTGLVRATQAAAVWLRPGLIEEYGVSTDGVRQDFVLPERPSGSGELTVELDVTGARAEAAAFGVKLTVTATGRELAYCRLKVTDAAGQELTARLDVRDAAHLTVCVDDAGAVYPVRIDPTFSDADWVALNTGLPGANGEVYAMAVDGSGNLYVGGKFTAIGTVAANHIAKWDGSAWSALGSGMDDDVEALAVSGSTLYAGGGFITAGGTSANSIAKWNGSAWSALGSGMNDGVSALAVSGSDLYAGGVFTTAGGTSADFIAKWNGSAWSALGSGMNDGVSALAVSGSDLYAGGVFTTAGGTSAKYIAKWNGSAWSALGSGMDDRVDDLAVSGSDLYAGGYFTTAGGTSANRIAKWNGSAWSALGSGMDGSVLALAVSGSTLYAGGRF